MEARKPGEAASREILAQRLRSLDGHARAALRKKLTAAQSLSGHALVAEALRQCGVERLSGIMGTPIDGIFSACHGKLRVMGFRHQMNAVLASASDNFANGHLIHAVCVSAGPAIMNTLNGVYYARDNHWPVLIIAGRRALRGEGQGYFQELDAVPILKPLTKWAATVREPSQIMPMIREAIQKAIEGEPGPVFLEIPEDVLEGTASPLTLKPPQRPSNSLNADEISETLQLLRDAEAPLLCLGEDLRWEVDLGALLSFLERENIPWITTPMARGILPEEHPLCMNTARRRLPKSCDCFLLAGAYFDWRLRFGAEISPNAAVVHVHPESDKLGRNVQAKIAVNADPGSFLNALASTASTNPAGPISTQSWVDQAQSECRAVDVSRAPWMAETGRPMPPQAAFLEIAKELPDNARFCVDGNIVLSCAQFTLFPKQPYSWIDPGWNGLIGGSLGLAMGLKLAHPDQPIISIVSDTSFGMSGMELETCARHGINIIIMVCNNWGNTGALRDRQWLPDTREPVSVYEKSDYHKIGEALGIHSEQATTPESAARLVREAIRDKRAVCINAIFDKNAPHPGFW